MKKILMVLVAGMMVLWSTVAFSTAYSFGDSVYHWNGWLGQSSYGWDDDKLDVIGSPNISGGVATVQGSNLQSVTFNFTANSWHMIAPGNLFINILENDNDKIWDYVVNTMGAPRTSGLAAGDYGLYSVAVNAEKGVNDSSYVLSGKDNTGTWAGYVIRDNHPIGIAGNLLTSNNLIGNVGFSGFPGSGGTTGSSTYDFTKLGGGGLDLTGKSFILGWEMTCANDVIYEKIIVTDDRIPPTDIPTVPEPSTMLFFSAGLVGLALVRRKRK